MFTGKKGRIGVGGNLAPSVCDLVSIISLKIQVNVCFVHIFLPFNLGKLRGFSEIAATGPRSSNRRVSPFNAIFLL